MPRDRVDQLLVPALSGRSQCLGARQALFGQGLLPGRRRNGIEAKIQRLHGRSIPECAQPGFADLAGAQREHTWQGRGRGRGEELCAVIAERIGRQDRRLQTAPRGHRRDELNRFGGKTRIARAQCAQAGRAREGSRHRPADGEAGQPQRLQLREPVTVREGAQPPVEDLIVGITRAGQIEVTKARQ